MADERNPRLGQIETFAGNGDLGKLQNILESGYTQVEIDAALENAIAYSQMATAEYLISLGADLSYGNYQGAYYAVHNNELNGLKFAISQGVDINVNEGMLLNESIVAAMNSKNSTIVRWLLNNGADLNLLSYRTRELIKKFGPDDLKGLITF